MLGGFGTGSGGDEGSCTAAEEELDCRDPMRMEAGRAMVGLSDWNSFSRPVISDGPYLS